MCVHACVRVCMRVCMRRGCVHACLFALSPCTHRHGSGVQHTGQNSAPYQFNHPAVLLQDVSRCITMLNTLGFRRLDRMTAGCSIALAAGMWVFGVYPTLMWVFGVYPTLMGVTITALLWLACLLSRQPVVNLGHRAGFEGFQGAI